MGIKKTKAIKILERLRDEAYNLASKPKKGKDFNRWYNDVVQNIQLIFGADSEELKELQQISFKIDPEILHKATEKFREAFQSRFKVTLPNNFKIPQEKYYRERLYEAAELLFAFKIRLT